MSKEIPIRPRFSSDAIAERVADMGRQIRDESGEAPILLIAILKGSAVFLADLLRAIPGEVGYQFVDVIQDEADTGTASATALSFFTHFEIAGKNIVLLKDVVSTGVIESYLLDQFRGKKPRSLRLAALIDRPGLRTMDLRVDYAGFATDLGAFVGYGLELGGRFGNLPYIGEVTKAG